MAMQFIKLNVEGMSCAHCENAVRKAVGEIDGVSTVEVSLKDKTVSAEFDPEKASEGKIREAIEDQGYSVVD